MNNIISIKNLSFSYGNKNILEDISFEVKKGDFIAIIGSNGSGKTTLLKLILNELKVNNGEIVIGNTDIKDFKEWNKIGYVPQITGSNIPNFPINAIEIVTLNLYEKMGFFKFSKKKHIELAKRALAQVNMLEHSYMPINKMSGGQQQRVMIAKALINNPKILIFDEPTTGVDKDGKEQLIRILTHLNRVHGITILLVTHELDLMKEKLTKIIEVNERKIEVI